MSITLAISCLQMTFRCDYSEGLHFSHFLLTFTPPPPHDNYVDMYFSSPQCATEWHPSRMWHKAPARCTNYRHSVISDERNIGWVKPRVKETANNTSYPVIATWCMESFTDLMISSTVARASSSSAVPSEFLLHFSISWLKNDKKTTWKRLIPEATVRQSSLKFMLHRQSNRT